MAAPDLVLSINLSPLQFRDPELCPQIFACIERHGLAPWQLELEITEGVLMENADEIESNLACLIEAGFQLAIDDFGTGYSSLARLTRLPIDTVKIDRTFVAGIAHDKGCAAVVSATMSLAEVLGLVVVAEGVETQDQCDRLQQLGCEIGQVWLFSGPLDHDQFIAWLRR